jgi:hypothetical protein
MLSIFCPSCGAKSSYELKKPSVCGYCSEPFNTSMAKIVPTKKTIKSRREEIENDEEEIEEYVDIQAPEKIAVELVIEGSNGKGQWYKEETRQESIARLRGRAGAGEPLANSISTNVGASPEVRRTVNPKANQKQILEALKKESISNRTSIEVG